MLIVHHLGVSQSERIVWLCEELSIPYELKRYEREAQTRLAPPAYKALHPLGTAPVITDGAVVLPESGAIMDYILQKYGGGKLIVTADKPNFADYLFWFHFANGSLMPNAMLQMVSARLNPSPDHPALDFIARRREAAYGLIEARLGESAYLAGPEFTAADIIMGFPLTTMRAFVPKDLSGFPNIRAYLKKIGDRPAYRRAMAKGDPDMPLTLD